MSNGTRVLGITGWQNAGKTTVLAGLIPELTRRGYTVSTVKRAHHAFDVDQPGKDSYTHRTAGALEVLVSSAQRFALMHELRDEPELRLAELLQKLAPVDIVLIEGFKNEAHVKFEVYRVASGGALLFPGDPTIRAFVSDAGEVETALPRVAPDDFVRIADLALEFAAPIASII